MKNLIVSSADAKYSHLLIELFQSLEPSLKNNYDFAIFDCGLNAETINFFIDYKIKVIKPDWEFDVPIYKIRNTCFQDRCVCII